MPQTLTCIKSGRRNKSSVSGQVLLCLQVNGPKKQTVDTDLSIFMKRLLHAPMTHFQYVIVLDLNF